MVEELSLHPTASLEDIVQECVDTKSTSTVFGEQSRPQHGPVAADTGNSEQLPHRSEPVCGGGTSFNLDSLPPTQIGETPGSFFLPSPAWSESDLSVANVLRSDHTLSKQRMCDFFNQVLGFLRFLTNLSEELRSFNPKYYRNIPLLPFLPVFASPLPSPLFSPPSARS